MAQNLVTAWDLFSGDSPGTKSRYESAGLDIYGMLENLIQDGKIFLVKTVKE
jgi:hypothetical protein